MKPLFSNIYFLINKIHQCFLLELQYNIFHQSLFKKFRTVLQNRIFILFKNSFQFFEIVFNNWNLFKIFNLELHIKGRQSIFSCLNQHLVSLHGISIVMSDRHAFQILLYAKVGLFHVVLTWRFSVGLPVRFTAVQVHTIGCNEVGCSRWAL